MASTMCRIYNLEPGDVSCRRAPDRPDEVTLYLGDTVGITLGPGQLRALLDLAKSRVSHVEAQMRPRSSEPF